MAAQALRLEAGPTSAFDQIRPARHLLFCCVMVLCLLAMMLQASEDGQWIFWISNFIFFGVLLNFLAFIRRRSDIFEPVVLVGGMFLLAFAVRGLFLYFTIDPTWVNSWVLSNLGLLGRMSSYITAGFALFLLGYYCPLGSLLARLLPRMKTTWDMDRLGRTAIRIYCICLPAKLLGVVPPGAYAFQDVIMTYAGNVIGLMASLTDVALLLYGIYYYRNKRQGMVEGKRAFAIMLMVQLAAGFLTGYREPLFISLLALLFVRHYVWRPLKPWRVVGGFLAVMLVVTPASREYRRLVWEEGQAPLDAVGDLSRQAVSFVGKQRASDDEPITMVGLNYLLNISNRFHGADSLITCLATVPDFMEYQNGKTLYLLPLSVFVPRALWPDKPKIGLGTYFREHIWKGPWNESDSGGQIAITQVGELYINFGLWGIVIGMVILGVFHRFAYSYSIDGHEPGNYTVLLFYFAAVLCFLATERNLAFAYGYLIKLFLFLYFLCRCLNRGPVFARS